MKKSTSILIILIFMALAHCHAYTKYVTANLNMRYGPGTRYGVVCIIPQGTPVTIDEDCDCKWVVVEYQGKIGYISSRYLTSNNIARNSSITRNHPTSRYKSKTDRYKPVTRPAPSPRGSIRHYINAYGNRVQSPTYYDTTPNGATALCRDGTYSFSQSRRGTCSHHGGVARWL